MYVSCLLNGSIVTSYVCFSNRKEKCHCLTQTPRCKGSRRKRRRGRIRKKNKKPKDTYKSLSPKQYSPFLLITLKQKLIAYTHLRMVENEIKYTTNPRH